MLNKTVKIIEKRLQRIGDGIEPDDDLAKMHNMDSLDCIEIVMGLEDEFAITISDEDLENSDPRTARDFYGMVLEAVSDTHGAKAA